MIRVCMIDDVQLDQDQYKFGIICKKELCKHTYLVFKRKVTYLDGGKFAGSQ